MSSNAPTRIDGAPRLGLCIGGGGANGAYALGAIRTLIASGIKPDYVSGTSVGALIGAALATGSLDEIEGILLGSSAGEEVLPRNTLFPGRRGAAFTPLLVFFLFAVIPQIYYVLYGRLHHVRIAQALTSNKWAWRALTFLIIAPSGFMAAWVLWNFDPWLHAISEQLPLSLSVIVIMTVFPFCAGHLCMCADILTIVFSISPKMDEDSSTLFSISQIFLLASLVAPGFLFSFWVMSLKDSILLFDGINDLVFILLGFVPPLTAVGIVFVLYADKLSLWLRTHLHSLTVFSNATLSSAASEILTGTKIKTPIFVTTSQHLNFSDPDDYRTIAAGSENGGFYEFISSKEQYVPYYFHFGTKDDAEQMQRYLIASAAIPANILPPVKIDNELHFDGMLSDNIPLTPLIYEARCEIIVVIAMQPDVSIESLLRDAEQNSRLLEVINNQSSITLELHKTVKNDPPVEIPLPGRRDCHYVVVKPESNLGSPIDFGVQKQKRIFDRGAADMRDSISGIFDGETTQHVLC